MRWQHTATRTQVLREASHLGLAGKLAREKQPEDTLCHWLPAADCRGQLSAKLREGVPTHPDALERVKLGRLPQHALDPAHAA